MSEEKDIYPLTLVRDRYNGVYSGGSWLAYNKHPWEVEDGDEFADDVSCMDFWEYPERNHNHKIGVGYSKDEAISNLSNKLEAMP